MADYQIRNDPTLDGRLIYDGPYAQVVEARKPQPSQPHRDAQYAADFQRGAEKARADLAERQRLDKMGEDYRQGQGKVPTLQPFSLTAGNSRTAKQAYQAEKDKASGMAQFSMRRKG